LDNIEICERLGSGNFGTVYRGVWRNCDVALKEMKDPSNMDFKNENSVLMSLAHPFVVLYLGTYTSNGRMFIVTEYMKEGNLQNFVSKYASSLEAFDLVEMAKQAAAGMTYLHSKSIIHRDLALRNMLVGSYEQGYTVKIADFGMSKKIKLDQSVFGEGQEIPFRWVALEVFAANRFNIKTDIWSFAVTLWELFSFGLTPYEGLSFAETFQKIQSGYRLPKPEYCPQEVYDLMLRCWSKNPDSRPNFEEIFDIIAKLNYVALPKRKNNQRATIRITEGMPSSTFYYVNPTASFSVNYFVS